MQSTNPEKTDNMGHPNETNGPLAASAEPRRSGATAATALPSQDLLRGEKTVVIEHNGTVYRLQSTRAGKLILTK
jgi:hemin uptake protein HemP